jgi:Ca-activated chloride channel family protein
MRTKRLTLSILVVLLGACQQPAVHDIALDDEAPVKNQLAGADTTAEPEFLTPESVENLPANAEPAAVAQDAIAGARESMATGELAKARAQGITRAEMRERKDGPALAMMMSPPPAPAPAGVYAPGMVATPLVAAAAAEVDTEHYASHADNPVHRVADDPVSTFSIDVDTGSYSNVRRMLLAGQRPSRDAVRAEEMINYFDYGYAAPADRSQPFRVSTAQAAAPWNAHRRLVQVGIQGYRVPAAQVPASNLVFLVDTSGSMQDEDKLPLLKRSFAELVERLRPQDRVSIVVYAGSAGLVLPPTAGDHKREILEALDRLDAGGSTNGGAGLQLAYTMARQAFVRDGVNRVLLATDGDFNVGTVDQKALETMIADQRKSGVALTTLGFGTGNYNDAMAERLADVGDGNHAYIDSIAEARKVLVEEAGATLLTIASDVKVQVEFNPAVVAEYRLIGYENRALRREDFDNDRVDAGEIGAGHDVTALYEVTLVGSGGEASAPLRYGRAERSAALGSARGGGCELGWLKLRYKLPGAQLSKLVQEPLGCEGASRTASPALRWSAAVAAYADLLRGGEHMGSFGWDGVRALAVGAQGPDPWGRRAEFLDLVERARTITGGANGASPVAVSQ